MSDDKLGNEIAEYLIATSEAEELKNYIDRGRPYKLTDPQSLKSSLVDLFHQYALDPSAFQDKWRLDDITCEYRLRGEEPPYEKADVELLVQAVTNDFESMDKKQMAEANAQMINDYLQAKTKEN